MTIAMPVILALAGYFVFSAAAGAMYPPSDAQKAGFYGWFYRFVQRLAANADKLVEARYGGLLHPGQQPADDGESVETLATERSSFTVATSSGK